MINIGLVGLGGMGSVHYSNYQYIKEGCVVAAVGKTAADREKAEQWGLPLYDSVTAMVQEQSIDIVDVCVPTYLHKAVVLEAIAGGKNVICEKPIALCYDDAVHMYAAAEERGVHIYVGQVLRFYKESQVLKQLVESEEYGKVLDARFERLSACPRWAQEGWLFDKSKSGLIPFDLHIHDLDLMISLFGKPMDYSYTSCRGSSAQYPEHYRFTYRFNRDGRDITACAEAAWYNADIPFTAGYRIYFEKAVLVSEGGVVTAYEFDKEPRIFDTEEKIKIPTGINLPPTGVFFEELSHFLSCFSENRPSAIIKKEEVLEVIKLLTEISGGASCCK